LLSTSTVLREGSRRIQSAEIDVSGMPRSCQDHDFSFFQKSTYEKSVPSAIFCERTKKGRRSRVGDEEIHDVINLIYVKNDRLSNDHVGVLGN